jgi:hypothetical protein
MKRVPAVMIVAASLATMAATRCAVQVYDQRVNGFAGVGGREAYEARRAEHLQRLKQNEYVTDPAIRAADAAAIDAEFDEIGRFGPVLELGEELRRVK